MQHKSIGMAEDIIARAQKEMHSFERVSLATARALVSELSYLRAALACRAIDDEQPPTGYFKWHEREPGRLFADQVSDALCGEEGVFPLYAKPVVSDVGDSTGWVRVPLDEDHPAIQSAKTASFQAEREGACASSIFLQGFRQLIASMAEEAVGKAVRLKGTKANAHAKNGQMTETEQL